MATNRLPAASRKLHDNSTISLEIGARSQAACGSTLTFCLKTMHPEEKTVNYHDGMMTFRIPGHWREDRETEGSDFYDPDDNDRTLHLTVMNFSASEPKPLEFAKTTLDAGAEKFGGEVTNLGNFYYFSTHERVSEEDGKSYTHVKWLLSRMINDTGSHLAIFTYTYPDSLRTDPQTLEDIAFLQVSARGAKFYEIENPTGAEQDSDGQA